MKPECNHCGKNLQPHINSCPFCNQPIKRKSFTLASIKNFQSVAALVVIGILGVAVLYYMIAPSGSEYGKMANSPVQSSRFTANSWTSQTTEIFDPDVQNVVSYFNCSCGSCNEHSLANCDCPTAKSEHKFIKSQLNQGKNVKEVRLLVYNKYRNEKSQYSDWFQQQTSSSSL